MRFSASPSLSRHPLSTLSEHAIHMWEPRNELSIEDAHTTTKQQHWSCPDTSSARHRALQSVWGLVDSEKRKYSSERRELPSGGTCHPPSLTLTFAFLVSKRFAKAYLLGVCVRGIEGVCLGSGQRSLQLRAVAALSSPSRASVCSVSPSPSSSFFFPTIDELMLSCLMVCSVYTKKEEKTEQINDDPIA